MMNWIYVDEKQNIWFKRKEIAELFGYQDLDQVIRKNVNSEDIKTYPVSQTGEVRYQNFTDESGLYSLVFASKKECGKKFKRWVSSIVLPSIRKYGFYTFYDNPNNLIIKIRNETELHYKVVDYIKRFYSDAIMGWITRYCWKKNWCP